MSATNEVVETVVERQNRELTEFVSRQNRALKRDSVIAQWHTAAYVSGGVPLPYQHDSTYCNGTVHATDDDGNWNIDVDATNKAIARVIKFCRKRGYKVEKEYDDDRFLVRFSFKIDPDSDADTYRNTINMQYTYDRKALCERRVVGTKVIPSSVEEVYEYDCKPVSFLSMDTD